MTCASNRNAFTLTELLVVITIISILLGMLYGAIRTVSRYSRETITRGELANIETAWNQYYNYYHTWPTNDVPDNGDLQYEIGPILAAMLAGNTNTPSATLLNPDAVPFLDLTRFDSTNAPVNAWGTRWGEHYSVILDVNGDNTLLVPSDSSGTPTNIFRRVAVWTRNPELNKIIGSWQQ